MIDGSVIRTDLVVVAMVVGIAALALATRIATRSEPAVRGGRARALAPLVPWLGSLAVLALLLRGAIVGAVVVALVTLVHAGLTRWRETVRRR